ncbi:hypothetical protein Tamer19_75250 [Cupriavidus sp. TA19]|uniref:hypothetical protein n=1 Tax=Cupriavidus sp. TA19 TaxID=701108 RepID=UPI00272948DB|nr:hypothetical protein [Cupriavidus sp. TA19]GLC98116.1 hypothetical protein Tamer19_75250 [Cupriavidus sp. TA19]
MENRLIGAGMSSYPPGVHLRVHVYQINRRPALSLVCADDDEPYANLTANVVHAHLADDEVFVAAWNLPEDVLEALLVTGWFTPVRMLATGHVSGPVWKIPSAELLAWIADARAEAGVKAP